MMQQKRQGRVLIVDDDGMSRELLSILLGVEGYAVESVPSGDAALAHLRSTGAVPDVVLSDVQMPGIAGYALARALRAVCGRGTVLVAMSGSDPVESEISEFDRFLLKPFAMHEFTTAVQSHSLTLAASSAEAASNHGMSSEVHESRVEADGTASRRPALDERIYGQLNEAMPKAQLHTMYDMCVRDARERIVAMRTLAAAGDATQFGRQAHAIKGGCGMLGATELYEMAAQLETSGLASNVGESGSGSEMVAGRSPAPGVNPLDELSDACDRLERILGSRA